MELRGESSGGTVLEKTSWSPAVMSRIKKVRGQKESSNDMTIKFDAFGNKLARLVRGRLV